MFRGISGNRAACNSIISAIDTAKSLPRCERLSGNTVRTDGQPVKLCPCTSAPVPHPLCPHATRHFAKITQLVAASQWAVPIAESDPVVMGALTAPQIASIRDVLDSEIRSFPRGESDNE